MTPRPRLHQVGEWCLVHSDIGTGHASTPACILTPLYVKVLPDPEVVGMARSTSPRTSKAAALSLKDGTRCRTVLDLFAKYDPAGWTNEELQDFLGWVSQSLTPRVNNLVNEGYLVDSGHSRPTRSGKEAVIWILTDEGRAKWKMLTR